MKIYCVGIGPGDIEQITPKAINAIKESNIVAGYNLYLELIKDIIKDKDIIASPMRKEQERVVKAIECAKKGKVVSIISSGDSGVYGMASLLFEMLESMNLKIDVEVIAGITAASSTAAVLGAPLSNDFAVISLSDLLTPYEKIEKRFRLALEGEFVIVIYNPGSKKRRDYLSNMIKISYEYLSEDTMCGYVKNVGREKEEYRVLTLKELEQIDADMFTTVIIGNSLTKSINGRLVTPRGYTIL